MRIRAFSKNIENESRRYNLKNCSVVIDGQNYFYNLYEEFELPSQFGCESDKYAEHLREHLSMYAKANVKCYIIFKGGHADEKKRFKTKDKYMSGIRYEVNEPGEDFVLPVFMKEVYKEVLDELGIDYVMCEFESKKQCIALAQKLKCPIISFDIEFAFSNVPYIPYRPSLDYDPRMNSIRCRLFILQNFMSKYRLTKEKLASFVLLTDENLFPAELFEPFFHRERIYKRKEYFSPLKRNQELLYWISKREWTEILEKSLHTLSQEDQSKFEEEYYKTLELIDRLETPGEAVNYLMTKCVSFSENDPAWFEKGVIANHIASSFVNLYYSDAFYGSWCIEDVDADDALFLSIDIIKYAFNLLNNYQKDTISFHNNKWEVQTIDVRETSDNSKSVRKPTYKAVNSPFENGWDDRLKSLKLFDHFLGEALSGLSFELVSNLPEDARLLMITLVYFARRKAVDMRREVYSILLSYVILGAVFPKLNSGDDNKNDCVKPNTPVYADLVTADCYEAISILDPFFNLSREELGEIFNRKLIHAFVEFQHCLSKMNNLNKLCGQRYPKTVYGKCYNGTFVYKVFYSLKNDSKEMALHSLKKMLRQAPTVLNFFMGLVDVFEQTMKS